MSNQGLLPGLEPATATDRLFLAIFPDGRHAAQLATLADHYLHDRGLQRGAVEASRLHVTLFHLGDYTGLPPHLVERATDALARLQAQPFTVCFDQVGSFGSRRAKSPLVLAASDGNEALHALQKQLAVHLRASGLGSWTQGSYVPHMTIAYGKAAVPFEPIKPVAWPAQEVQLVHSLLGQTRHIRLASKQLA